MKLILNLDDDTLENMQGYCEVQDIALEDMLTNLFNKYVQGPADIIDLINEENGDLRELQAFQKILMTYLNEAIHDIEESAESAEAYETDNAMAQVFKVLNRDVIDNPYVLTTLFKAYKEEN